MREPLVVAVVVGVLSGIEHEELFDEALNPIGTRDNPPGEVNGFAPPGAIHRIRYVGDETGVSARLRADADALDAAWALRALAARGVLVGHDGDRPAVEQRLRSALTTASAVRFRGPGETPFLRNGDAVLPQAHIKDRVGEFAYRRIGPGDEFEQDPAWQAEHLVRVDLPVIGPARCHRLVVDALAGALAEVASANLAGLIGPDGFAGCWNPRTTRGGSGISRHAWGVAVDINTGDNPTGLASVQDPRLVTAFGRWGFTEGSGWLVPDAGHFEYVAPPGG